MPTDLLDTFIAAKLSEAPVQPSAGVARDDPKPFGRQKAAAALRHLQLGGELDLAGISDAAGVSYSQIAKWRTEPAFRKAIRRYEEQFSDLVVAAAEDSLQRRDIEGLFQIATAVRRCSPTVRGRIFLWLKKRIGKLDADRPADLESFAVMAAFGGTASDFGIPTARAAEFLLGSITKIEHSLSDTQRDELRAHIAVVQNIAAVLSFMGQSMEAEPAPNRISKAEIRRSEKRLHARYGATTK